MFFLAEAVRFAGVDDHLGFNPVALQAAVEFLALAQRVREVRVTLENKRRRFAS